MTNLKKWVALLLAVMMMISMTAVAFAETYQNEVITFEYDETAFEITTDDAEDETHHHVILKGKDEAWGETRVRFYSYPMNEDSNVISTAEDVKSLLPDVEVTEGEWNGFADVISYFDGEEQLYLVPLNADVRLTVAIAADEVTDEAAAMARDDAISAILDSLKVAEA